MTGTSPHDEPWFSDPDYCSLGRRIVDKEPYWDEADRKYQEWKDRQATEAADEHN